MKLEIFETTGDHYAVKLSNEKFADQHVINPRTKNDWEEVVKRVNLHETFIETLTKIANHKPAYDMEYPLSNDDKQFISQINWLSDCAKYALKTINNTSLNKTI